MAEVNVAKGYFDNFVVRANDVIWFKMVRSEKDLDLEKVNKDLDAANPSFQPDFTHQLFGEQENIFGYRDLKIVVLYSSSHLNRFVSMTYSEKLPNPESIAPDDVMGILADRIPGPFSTNLDVFTKDLANEGSFMPFGEKLNEKVVTNFKTGVTRIFEVYRSEVTTKGWLDYHEKVQSWLLWFIDGASYIDVDDDRWEFFTIYERTNAEANGHLNGNSGIGKYHFVGYCTVYRYFAYPEKVRPRISQFLILPPFQQQGLGRHLLQSIYDYQIGRKEVLDITVEDPSDNFVRLRDFVDCVNCSKLSTFSTDSLLKGWSEDMALEAQDNLKLNKRQTRRVYEILKLKAIDRSKEDSYRKFRLEVKNRLNAPFLKMNQRKDVSIDQTGLLSSPELRQEELKNLYHEVESEYLETIDKLSVAR